MFLMTIIWPPLHGTLASCSSSYGKISRSNVQERSAMRLGTDRAGGGPPISCRGVGCRGGITCQDMPMLTICSHQGLPSAWLTVGRRGGNSGQIFAKLCPLGLLSMGKGQLSPYKSEVTEGRGVFKEMITSLLHNHQGVTTELQLPLNLQPF